MLWLQRPKGSLSRMAIVSAAMAVPAHAAVVQGFVTMQQQQPSFAQQALRLRSAHASRHAPCARGAIAPLLLTPSSSLLASRGPGLPPAPPGLRRQGPADRQRTGASKLSASWGRDADELSSLGGALTGQTALIITSFVGYALIAAYVGVGPILHDGIAIPMDNVLPAIICFGGADLFTQAYEGYKSDYKKSLDVRRVFAACMVGLICNAVGMPIWLYFLDNLVPKASIGLAGAAPLSNLVLKALTHSLVWGTIANSISLILRRLITGDSLRGSLSFWNDKILNVTSKQLFFWPAFMCGNFALVPPEYQIQATALGAFVFNVFMSFIASAPPRPVEQETFDLIKVAMTTDAPARQTFELVEAAMSAPAVPEDRLEEELQLLLNVMQTPLVGLEAQKELLRTALAAPVVQAQDAELIKVAMMTAALSEETFEVVTQALAREPAVEASAIAESLQSMEADLDAWVPSDEAEAAEELIKAALAAAPAVPEGAPTDAIVIT